MALYQETRLRPEPSHNFLLFFEKWERKIIKDGVLFLDKDTSGSFADKTSRAPGASHEIKQSENQPDILFYLVQLVKKYVNVNVNVKTSTCKSEVRFQFPRQASHDTISGN